MKFNEVNATFAPPPRDIPQQIDYSGLDQKWSHDPELNQKYKLGQQYKLTDETPLCVVELIVDGVFDYIKQQESDPGNKIILENHRDIIKCVIKNLHDSKITVDFKHIMCIIDGILYANGRPLYRKDSR